MNKIYNKFPSRAYLAVQSGTQEPREYSYSPESPGAILSHKIPGTIGTRYSM